MALIVRRQAQLRAKELQFVNAAEIHRDLEADLRALVDRQSAWKQKIMFKIMVASIRQEVARQRRLYQRLERINRVSYFNTKKLVFSQRVYFKYVTPHFFFNGSLYYLLRCIIFDNASSSVKSRGPRWSPPTPRVRWPWPWPKSGSADSDEGTKISKKKHCFV
jgi:hypothetical protein